MYNAFTIKRVSCITTCSFVLSLRTVDMNISPAFDLDLAFHVGSPRIQDTNIIVQDNKKEDLQSLQKKNATEGFQNGLDWIHFTGGGSILSYYKINKLLYIDSS
jgi:hypothetical protein